MTDERWDFSERMKREVAEAFARGDGAIYNVFVPTFAPQYSDMVARGGRPGVSLEDKNRAGVWVPLSWLKDQQHEKRRAWKQFSADELLARYSPPQSEPT